MFPSLSNIFHLYVLFVSFSGINTNPSGTSSFISAAYPSWEPSLYTLIVYVTISPFSTLTGFFVWLYIAVVSPFNSVLTSTFGSLLVIFLSFIPVINFLKDKSKYFPSIFNSS